MLDGSDKETFHAIRLLRDCAVERAKPIMFWKGAGTSAWCGYPLWGELAENVHSDFLKYETVYDTQAALRLIKSHEYPDFFQLCCNTNSQRYYTILANTFSAKPICPVYARYIGILTDIQPCFILTTNVDESLENNIPGVTVVQRSDIERCIHLLRKQQSFVGKLHGSISTIKTTVFTSDDYTTLIGESQYLNLLKHIFGETTVVFLGYSLGDQYVLDTLQSSAEQHGIFGDGPHFAVISDDDLSLPTSVRRIRYLPDPHRDHRSAMHILDTIRHYRVSDQQIISQEAQKVVTLHELTSAYFISDIYPVGRWTTSQTLDTTGIDVESRQVIVGQGFADSEMPSRISNPMHDLIVGLICFEVLYLPLSSLSRLHDMFGSGLFWRLVKDRVFRFIHWEMEPGIIFRDQNTPKDGDLGSIIGPLGDDLKPTSIEDVIKRHLKPIPGKEDSAAADFRVLESMIDVITNDQEPSIPDLTRGLLLRPEIKQLLGISDAVVPTKIPRWAAFPSLRLSHTIKIGLACNRFKIAAVKIPFGGEQLAAPVFAASAANDWADENASYVLSGRFNSDLGKLVFSNPRVISAILKFRESQAGIALRGEILDQLSVNSGGDFISSINAGLKSSVPKQLLEKARDQLSGLLCATGSSHLVTPAVWNNLSYSDTALKLWRRRSTRILSEYCREQNIGEYDPCPCGSGEKLRFCCNEALK